MLIWKVGAPKNVDLLVPKLTFSMCTQIKHHVYTKLKTVANKSGYKWKTVDTGNL
jgi:hypothetical protein